MTNKNKITEGPSDPHVFKAIFMSGVPGAGKSSVAKSIQKGTGLKLVDYDEIYEYFLKLKKDHSHDTVKSLLQKKLSTFINGRLGLIIDKTSHNYGEIMEFKSSLENLGYETSMVFVNTDIDRAKGRVADRFHKTGRNVDSEYIDTVFKKLLRNIGKFQKDFGENFFIVDNSRQFNEKNIQKRISKFLRRPPNHIAKKWISNYSYQNSQKTPISEDYPVQFSMDEFQKIKSFLGKKKYADKHLKRISSGSSRIVYQVDNTKVLKLAKNKRGLAQNKIETDWGIQHYEIAAKVFDFDEENSLPFWVEMELAIPLTRKKNRFQDLTNVTVEDLFYYLSSLSEKNKFFHIDPYLKEELNENEWVQSVVHLASDFDMPMPGDLSRLSSYGEVKRDGKPAVVLIDFGLTKDVHTEYYS